MIVIDVGCARYGGDYSIERLIEEFHPDVLYGFDPNPVIVGVLDGDERGEYRIGKTKIILERKAAWIFDGEIGFVEDGLGSRITERTEEPRVKCFDLAGFLCDVDSRHVHPSESPAIALKIDAEGAEYDILDHVIETGHNRWLKLIWVEWHPPGAKVNSRPDARREAIEERIGCEMHQWNH